MTNALNPEYYNKHKVVLDNGREVTPYDVFANQCFALGNIGKYLLRYKDKNGIEDLKKALWYLKECTSQQERIDADESKFSDYEYELELNKLSKVNPLMEAYITLLRTEFDDSYYEAAQNLKELIYKEINELTPEEKRPQPLDFYYYVTTFNACVRSIVDDKEHSNTFSIASDLEELYDYQKQVTRLHMMHQANISHEDPEYQETLTKIVLYMQSTICALDIGLLVLAGVIAGSLKDISREEIKKAQAKALSTALSADEFDKETMDLLGNVMSKLMDNKLLEDTDVPNLELIEQVLTTNFIQNMLDCLDMME